MNRLFIFILPLINLIVVSVTFSQEKKFIQIKGYITNQQNEALPYVFVYDKLGKKGYLSNEKGEINIFVEKGTELVFSCMGYKKQLFPVPVVGQLTILFLRIKLLPDTILLKEITIFPWKTYQQFIQAVLNTEIPDDDIARAERNIEVMKNQLYLMEYDDKFQSSSIAFKLSQQQLASALYWKGQTQPLQLFNIMAWQEFIRYLREGKFKRKDKKD